MKGIFTAGVRLRIALTERNVSRVSRRMAGCQDSHAAECSHLPQVPSQQAEALILFTFGHSIGGGTRKRSAREVLSWKALLRRRSVGWVAGGLRFASGTSAYAEEA